MLVEQVTLHGEKEDIYFRTEADRDTFLKEYAGLDDSAKRYLFNYRLMINPVILEEQKTAKKRPVWTPEPDWQEEHRLLVEEKLDQILDILKK